MIIEYDPEAEEVVVRIPYRKGSYKRFDLSTSGKSYLIATTKGNADVPKAPDNLRIGINLYVPTKRRRYGIDEQDVAPDEG